MSCYLFVTSVVFHLLCQLHSQWSAPVGCLHSPCVGPHRIWTLVSSCLQNVQMGVRLMTISQENIYPAMDPRHRLENIHQRVGWTAWGAVVPCLAAWAQFVFLFERASTWSVRIGNRRRAEFYVYIFFGNVILLHMFCLYTDVIYPRNISRIILSDNLQVIISY